MCLQNGERKSGMNEKEIIISYNSVFTTVLILVAVLSLLAFFIAFFPAEAESIQYVNVSYGSSLNVHDWDDISSDIIAWLPRGEKVIVSDVSGDWSKILFVNDNRAGWVKSQYLTDDPPEELPIGKYDVLADNLAVRKKPSGTAKIVMRLEQGKQTTVKGWIMKGDVLWAKVNGGYIMGEYLSVAK